MQVKRFTATSMSQAMRMVRQELGPDAVILATGRLPGGGVEISAAVEHSPVRQSGQADVINHPPLEPRPAPVDDPPAPAEPLRALRSASLDPGLEGLVKRVDSLSKTLAEHLVRNEAEQLFAGRPEVIPLYQHLKNLEVNPAIIIQLLDGLSGQGLLSRLSIRLKQLIQVSGPPKVHKGTPAVLSLVGPTGVGKTTTVAKLAATFLLKQRLSVGMITVDTFRMAAAEQLETYGRIMEVPTLVAGDREELVQALGELQEHDIILIDTVGRAPGDEDNLDELQNLLAGAADMETHLVLASPTRDEDQKRVMQSFMRFNPGRLIFTKLDESGIYGPVLNRMVDSGLPVSYLTFGQKVPDDLEEATRDGLAKRFLPTRSDLERL